MEVKATINETNAQPCGIVPFDKDWGTGYNSWEENPSPFPRVNRLKKFVDDYPFTVDHERAYLVTQAHKKHSDKPQIIRCAKALAHVLENFTIHILRDELIIGEMGAPIKSAPIFPEFSLDWILDEMKNHPWNKRLHDKYTISKKSEAKLKGIASFWKGNTVEETVIARMSEDEFKGTHLGRGVYLLNLYLSGGIGHTQANYEKLLAKGFGGHKKEVRKKLLSLDPTISEDLKKREFYEAEIIVLDASTALLKRYSALAGKLKKQEKNQEWKEALSKIEATCDWVADNPPRTFREALQLCYIATTIVLTESNGHSVSYGRFDQYMFPFYQQDIASGTETKESIQELLEIGLFIKDLWWTKLRDRLTVIANSGRGMGGDSLTIGGVDEQGRDATNDLSYMILDAQVHTRSGVPWVAVRLHENSTREFKIKAFNVVRLGTGQPKLFNDQAAVPSMIRGGRTEKDARNYHVVGCVEIDAGGKEYGWHDSAYFSIAKILEFAINDGRCMGCGAHCLRWDQCGGIGKQIGPQTGSLADFTSFDQVKDAYDKQMKYWCDQMIAGTEIMDLTHQELKPLPFLSTIMDDCTGKGLDVSAGGAVYNFTGPQAVGVGTVADGLAAIKQLVFEEKKVTGEALLDACEKNWVGYDPLYALVNSSKVHHYGNDDDYADELACFGVDTYCKYIENRPNSRGGHYLPGV